ncbi:MAG TPA: SCO family protein [Frateuria sp.]|uniref:SCO family protein n=1 Tax=Frateuria sp. TaxID=2211372 RepID=UPI002D7F939B|nr:SCO family protein [Frateuria sp.]HET6806392.1 SCO family protein [Frateuria sp.]
MTARGFIPGKAPSVRPRSPVLHRGRAPGALLPVVWLLVLLMPVARATRAPPPPADLSQRAGFDQRLGAEVPMDARFVDADGAPVDLRTLAEGKPLLLALGYYRCPNLCDVVLNGMAHTLGGLDLRPGRDFAVAFVGIDPAETPADARHAQAMLAHRHPDAHVPRWHFLTGEPAAIGALARAIGFRYFYDERLHQYAHAAGLVVVTPDGKVAQYFFGVSWPPASLRLALVNASHGGLGSLVDRLVLLCCGYDPTTGRYSLAIGRTMQVLGVAFVLALAGGWLWLRRRRRA